MPGPDAYSALSSRRDAADGCIQPRPGVAIRLRPVLHPRRVAGCGSHLRRLQPGLPAQAAGVARGYRHRHRRGGEQVHDELRRSSGHCGAIRRTLTSQAEDLVCDSRAKTCGGLRPETQLCRSLTVSNRVSPIADIFAGQRSENVTVRGGVEPPTFRFSGIGTFPAHGHQSGSSAHHQCFTTIGRGRRAALPWAASSDSAETISASRPSTVCR